jgi:hypothetical protein
MRLKTLSVSVCVDKRVFDPCLIFVISMTDSVLVLYGDLVFKTFGIFINRLTILFFFIDRRPCSRS